MTLQIPENIPNLSASADLGRSVNCKFNAAIKRSLRMRRDDGSQAADETRAKIEEVLTTLNALLHPMKVTCFTATLPPTEGIPGPALDVWRLVHLPVFIHAAIASHRQLLGQPVEITAHLIIPDTREPAAAYDAHLKVSGAAIGSQNDSATSGLKTVSARAGRYWVQAVSTVIGPWAAVSGISELRIGGVFHAVPICSTGGPTAQLDPRTDRLGD